MNLSQDGTISGGLFLYIALETTRYHNQVLKDADPNLDVIESRCLAMIEDLRTATTPVHKSDQTHQFVRTALRLFKDRHAGMHQPDLALSKLRKMHLIGYS
jgi:hypothetical protein